MKNTISVDDYFDKLLSLIHQDYDNYEVRIDLSAHADMEHLRYSWIALCPIKYCKKNPSLQNKQVNGYDCWIV